MPQRDRQLQQIFPVDLQNSVRDNPKFFGFCYTQLYDIEQEINGLYTYERIPKFDVSIFKKINAKKAAIE